MNEINNIVTILQFYLTLPPLIFSILILLASSNIGVRYIITRYRENISGFTNVFDLIAYPALFVMIISLLTLGIYCYDVKRELCSFNPARNYALIVYICSVIGYMVIGIIQLLQLRLRIFTPN